MLLAVPEQRWLPKTLLLPTGPRDPTLWHGHESLELMLVYEHIPLLGIRYIQWVNSINLIIQIPMDYLLLKIVIILSLFLSEILKSKLYILS